jgi:hypothetical protein
MRANQVVECEEILEQWSKEYTAAQATRKSWLSSVCEQSLSESRFTGSVGGDAQVPRRGRKRKIFCATLGLGLTAGATVVATGTAPLVLSLFTKTATYASVAAVI